MTDDLLETAQKMLERYALCDNCLGRQFALLGHGIANRSRGQALKLLLTMKAHQRTMSKDKTGTELLKTLATNGKDHMASSIYTKITGVTLEPKTCFICRGSLDSTAGLANQALRLLKQYEHNTFLVGIDLPAEVEENEDEFKGEFAVKFGENLRNEFSRDIGKKIAEITGKVTEHQHPEIVALINPFTERISLQINPIHISGRYRKLMRGIPQSRWFCGSCHGKGCRRCNWTGRMYPESVEEMIGTPTLETTQGEDIALHGAGREDIDARMLGRGRPFVIEVKRPKKRFIDLKALQRGINERAQDKVQVSSLRFANKDVVRNLKKSDVAQKLYKVTVEVDKAVSTKQLAFLRKSLVGTIVEQKTPRRVIHRRADMMREKYIYTARVKRLTPNRFELRVKCQGGLYIKELVTGDDGRTKPSVAQILKAKAVPLELDVLGVYVEEPKQ